MRGGARLHSAFCILHSRSAFCLLPFLLIFALPAFATSALTGRVTSLDKPLARASVTIDSDALQMTRITVTTARGTWWAGELPPGTYRVTFAHAGTQTVTRMAEVRLSETTRVNADLAPAEEGEAVTVTTMTRSILERPDIVTTVDPTLVEELPMARELSSRIAIAPGVGRGAIRRSQSTLTVVDGAPQVHRGADIEVEEALADVAVVTTASSVEYGRFAGGTVLAVTRTGGNDFSGSLRDTVTSGRWNSAPVASGGMQSRLEGTVGGRIVRDAVWFFLAGENGSSGDAPAERSASAKITASAGLRDTLTAAAVRASTTNERRGSVVFTHVANSRALITARIASSRQSALRENDVAAVLRTFIPVTYGDHQLNAGIERFAGDRTLFVTDHWNDGSRWSITAGARYDEHLGGSPRAGVSYDAGGPAGAHFIATWGRYRSIDDSATEETFGYARRVFNSGYARVMLVRKDYESGIGYKAVEADARGQYLFLTFGGSATVGNGLRSGTAWVSGTPPTLEQHVIVAFMERYRGAFATDASVQYRFTRYALQPFAKVDFLNLFDEPLRADEEPLGARRAVRVGLGLRY